MFGDVLKIIWITWWLRFLQCHHLSRLELIVQSPTVGLQHWRMQNSSASVNLPRLTTEPWGRNPFSFQLVMYLPREVFPIRIYWYGGETVYIFNVWCRILRRRFYGTGFSGRGVCTELGTDGLHSTILKTWDTMSVSLTLNHNLKKIVESIHS